MRTRAIAVAAALIVTTGAAHAAEIDAMITTAHVVCCGAYVCFWRGVQRIDATPSNRGR